MSEFTEKELIGRFTEGLKMSSDAMRMLGLMQQNSDFGGIAMIIDEIAKNARILATSIAMSKQTLDAALGRRQKVINKLSS